MILLIDIGNTRIKWASVADGRFGRVRAAGHAAWRVRDFEQVFGAAAGVDRVVVSSVASRKINGRLSLAARRVAAPSPEFVATPRRACGVTAAYREPWRLGVDRFLAMVGAHAQAARSTCIVGVGTAMTIDLLDGTGRHRGGAIIPAPPLMVSSLLQGTSGIRARARGGPAGRGGALFARSTRAAVEQGARYAAAAMVERAVREARTLLGRAPRVILTGGGAREVQALIRVSNTLMPDLVMRGLAVWAAQGRESRSRT